MRAETVRSDFLFDWKASEVDPGLERVIRAEESRQVEKLVMIASESICPPAVRRALGSVFTNVYAEGYPARRDEREDEDQLFDLPLRLAYYRRFGDRRYYKGTELVDAVESVARRRVSELFATAGKADAAVSVAPEQIYANVQALSGAAANNSVFSALLEPGDVIMGMDLTHGGHLTHGSPVNRSGRYYRVSAYQVNPETGRIDYDRLEAIAKEVQPKLIVAGASAFPWSIDWSRLRRIADSLPRPAQILADISHPAGLVVAGLFPNPVGIADVVTFTTHKTMIGPRAAVILTTSRDIGRRIDRAVFPGEQGGPHINQIAAMAVAFGIARTPEFHALQHRIVENARALAAGLERRGLRLAYGGTDTHLLLVDLKSLPQPSGVPVNGDMASRILDSAGIVCNKNTIAGDSSAVYPTGLRLGTVWLSQRGLEPKDMDRIAGVVHRVLTGITTFTYQANRGPLPRGKVDAEALAAAREEVRALVASTVDAPRGHADGRPTRYQALRVRGPRASAFLQAALPADVLALPPGSAVACPVHGPGGAPIGRVAVCKVAVGRSDAGECPEYALLAPAEVADRVMQWLHDLSDGYVRFDPEEVLAKVTGPVAIEPGDADPAALAALTRALESSESIALVTKPYFVGQWTYPVSSAVKPEFVWVPAEGPLRRTALHAEHKRLGARMVPFAGWEMPVWYTSIADEHTTVRTAAGLFDLAHMGVLEVSGEGAPRFLDLVSTNHVAALDVGKAQYSYLLDPDGKPLDDILIYRRGDERYLVVVNASNEDKVLAWLQAVVDRACLIDRERPDRAVDVRPTVRSLKDPAAGEERRVDLAIQGPSSLAILQAATEDTSFKAAIWRLRRFDFAEGALFGAPVLVSRTGYTGEALGYEVLVHPDRALDVWRGLFEVGAPLGLKPIGLGARDSLRTEAGFPLYGHELAGEHEISPLGASYPGFVKFHKPFFVGRRSALAAEAVRTMTLVRFRSNERGGRMLRPGDPVVDRRGEVVGFVTSCTAVDGIPLGLAYVKRSASAVDTPIGVVPTGGTRARPDAPEANEAVRLGGRVPVPEAARVISRFRAPDRSPGPATQGRGAVSAAQAS